MLHVVLATTLLMVIMDKTCQDKLGVIAIYHMVYFVAKFALEPYPPPTLIDANLGKNHLIDF